MIANPTQGLRILICGAAKDVENHMDNFMKITKRSFRSFANVEYLLCESFSTDATWKVLQKLSQNVPGFYAIQDNLKSENEVFRTAKIASARMRIQEFVKQRQTNYDYIVVMDIDGVNRSLNRKSVISCWKYSNWDVATANQPFRYYDLWALRAKDWLDHDIWQQIAIEKPNASQREVRRTLFKYYRSIPRTSKPIKVESAFGGLAIYTTEAFLAGRYQAFDKSGGEICEHVPFHREINAKGFKIFILPSLVNMSYKDQVIHICTQNIRYAILRMRTFLKIRVLFNG
jgi:hypothetical protein